MKWTLFFGGRGTVSLHSRVYDITHCSHDHVPVETLFEEFTMATPQHRGMTKKRFLYDDGPSQLCQLKP